MGRGYHIMDFFSNTATDYHSLTYLGSAQEFLSEPWAWWDERVSVSDYFLIIALPSNQTPNHSSRARSQWTPARSHPQLAALDVPWSNGL
jgi:hypothetical protein